MSMGGEILSNVQLNLRAKLQQSLANIIEEIIDFFYAEEVPHG